MAKRKVSDKQPTTHSTAFMSKGPVRYWSAIIFVLGFALYANTLFHNYVLDDAIVIYDNEFTTKGFAGFAGLLKYDTFRGFFKVEGKDKLVVGGRYRPLTPLMYAAEVQLFAPVKKDSNGLPVTDSNGNKVFDPNEGGKLNAVKFVGHLVNVLLFAFTGVVLFWLLLTLFNPEKSEPKPYGYAFFVALVASLFFVVHPIHSEAVANVKGRDEIVSLLGSLLALYLSFRSYLEGKKSLQWWAALIFFLALLSKENAITFLAVIPLSFYFFTKAKFGKIVQQTFPFLLVAITFVVLRGMILGWGITGDPSRELMNNPFLKVVGNQYVDFSANEKYGTIFFTLLKYLQLQIFPHPLSHDYFPRAIGIMTFKDWQVILSVVLHILLGIYALIRLPKKDAVSWGILYYLATLSIVSNLVFPIGTTMNERFAYMPSIGFFVIVAVMLYRVSGSWGQPKKPAMMAIGLVLLLLGTKTFIRNFAWKDNYTLFATDIKVSGKSAKLRNALGGETIQLALKPENADKKEQMIQEGIQHLQEALKIHPGYANAGLLMGNAYFYLNQFDQAIYYYRFALTAEDDYPDAKNNLFLTYRDGARYFGEKMGDLAKAEQYLMEAYKMRPNDFETLRLLGVVNGIAGKTSSAIEFFTKALEQNPNDASTMFNLGNAYYNAGDTNQGAYYLSRAREINPNIEAEMRGGN